MASPKSTVASADKKRNSAGRFLAALSGMDGSRSYARAIPPLIGQSPITSKDYQNCYIGLLALHELYAQLADDLSLNAQTRGVLNGLSRVKQTLYPSQLDSVFQPLEESEKSLLGLAAELLPEELPIERGDDEPLREAIRSLHHMAERTAGGPAVRATLLEMTRISDDALGRYKIHGARAFRRAVGDLLGQAMTLRASADENGAEDQFQAGIWPAVFEVLRQFDLLGSKLLGQKPMLHWAGQWLQEQSNTQ
jgi:hypothetical protein